MKFALVLLAFALSTFVSASASKTDYINSSAFNGCAPATESLSAGYEQIVSFGFGGTDTSTSGQGYRPSLQNLVVAKRFDACSGTIMTDFLTSTPFPTLTLVGLLFNPQTSVPTKTLTITLSNALITNYTLNGTSGNPEAEQISFTFTKACVATATAAVCYDPSGNVVK